MEARQHLRVKLDENLSKHLRPSLEDIGLDVETAESEGLLGKHDPEVALTAFSEGRMLFTLDVEFADLRKYRPGEHPGIVLFRPRPMGPLSVNRAVLAFARSADLTQLQGCITVVEPGRVRVRRPV